VTGGYPAIAYFVDENLGRSIGKWERDELDIVAGMGPELQVGSRTDERWGTGAAGADQRLIHRSVLGVDGLVVNQGSQTLADADVRRAVALALDRPILSRYWGVSTDEVLPLAMPGLVDKDRFPLDAAQVDEARALLAGRTPELRIAWWGPTFCAECPAIREAIAGQLAAVGIRPTFEEFDDPLLYANGADSGFDLAGSFVWSDFPDPAIWMEIQLSEALQSGGSIGAGFPRGWVPPELAAERDRVGELEGRERYEAALTLADRVADELVVLPYADDTYPQLISDSVGCTSFRAGTPWLDLAAACPG
jgi:ABC-type oligopeptide transport system substrate-binding subunit